MAAPDVTVEIGFQPSSRFFDYFVLDTSALDDTVDVLASDVAWTDITSDVRSVGIRRGKFRDIDEFTAGTLDITLNNADRKYDPINQDSIYYGNIEPRRPVRVSVTVNSVSYPLYYGYVQRWSVDYTQQNLPLAGIQAADALALLARQPLTAIAAAHSSDLPGQRIERVLDLAEVDFDAILRAIDDGSTVFGSTTYTEAGGNAGSYLQLAARSEYGSLFVNTSGVLTFHDRHHAPGVAGAVFSDDGGAASIPYLTIDQDFSDDLLYNRVSTAGTTKNVQTVSDSTSIAAYGVATLERTGLLASSDVEMLDQARVLLARFATPEMRLRQVIVDVAALTAAQQKDLVGLELDGRATVERTPPGAGTPASIEQATLVNGFDWQFVANPQSFRATVTFAAGKRAIGFVLDDVMLGQLDDDFLSY